MAKPFSERVYGAPFGRYQPGGEAVPPDNEVLVGREGQQTYFINLLFRMGRRGAFLVTGHRGVGKTSFVRHCLDVHREEVFERFLSSNVGRAWFWDRLGVLILGFVVLMALSMVSQLVDLLTLSFPRLSPLAWIVLVPAVLICSYPLLYAFEVLHVLWQTLKAGHCRRRPGVILVLLFKALLCLAVAVLLFLPPFLRPSPGEMRGSAQEDLLWILGVFLCLFALFHFEYTQIVRPFLHRRLGQEGADLQDADRYRAFARLTMPWILFKAWLPILRIPVNLGFEKLEHRRVIHAMLAGLREEYKKAFLSWRSGFANLVRILGALVLLALVHFVGSQWFELPQDIDVDETKARTSETRTATDTSTTGGRTTTTSQTTTALQTPASAEAYENLCGPFEHAQQGPAAANLICKLPGGDTLLKLLYYNLIEGVPTFATDKDHLLFHLVLPFRTEPWPEKAPPAFLDEGVHVELYHFLILGLLFILGRWLLRLLPILPYESTLGRIDEVMDFLSARTSTTSRTNRWEPIQILQGWLVAERTRQTDQDPADPRTVEFLFLQILDDIQSPSFHPAGRRGQMINLPTPEVTFVFDELDKLGTRVDPGEKDSAGGAQQAEILHAERRRSLELHKLLADMKNLLSSGPARFIFVGGRNLHDEWLADQGSRQPLLTNIFNAEVYLPSLLTDLGWRGKDSRAWDLNIDLYLNLQLQRAKRLFAKTKYKTLRPFWLLPIEETRQEVFTTRSPKRPRELAGKRLWLLDLNNDGRLMDDKLLAITLKRDFRQFLTYRSLGNPKRLKELLGTFMRPVNRLMKEGAQDNLYRDAIIFGDTERFRVQLVARIYRHLAQSFEEQLANRDDKLVVSLFYMSDFLFKFHRRAFSWGNLERVDELVHIHRAPDLREVLESLVGQWTERFLHPIRNGMYDFRFRSDLAREVEYISRQSPAEMAAFNFTLDESQALKSAYSSNIANLKERTGRIPIDMIAGLGELHEFDQEYEDARVYYWRAISLLDERLEEIARGFDGREHDASGKKGAGCDDADTSAVLASFMATATGKRLSRHFLTWGVSRLRLMLQIGMTFELTRNFERASIEYCNANTLAAALRTAMLKDPDSVKEITEAADGAMHPLKHLSILFQPVFAEAWIAEKMAGAIDTGISLIERELWTLRGQLPFVSDLQAQAASARNPVAVKSSNFSLIMAELHDKAADLYFFKGRQRVTLSSLEAMGRSAGAKQDAREEAQHFGHEGYLLRAHYHYAVALHEMRRLISYRKLSSRFNLSIEFESGSTTGESIETKNWPDFIFRSTGGALNDLAEATLGRVSLYGLVCTLPSDNGQNGVPFKADHLNAARNSIVKAFINWMEATDDRRGDFSFKLPHSEQNEALHSWFGRWTPKKSVHSENRYFPLIEFAKLDHQSDFTRLIAALQLKVAGSMMLEKGGYIEGAAHELLGVCEIVTHYLWWLRIAAHLLDQLENGVKDAAFKKELSSPKGPFNLIREKKERLSRSRHWYAHLANLALYSLQKADQLFRLGRKAEDEDPGSYLIGNQIPVAQLLLTCSLGLAYEHWEKEASARDAFCKEIKSLLDAWGVGLKNQQTLSSLLEVTLVRHSYPMVNRLHGLKLLIDHNLLQSGASTEAKPWILELQRLTAELGAPMHFTPLHSGVTYALAYFKWRINQSASPHELEKIRSAAQRDLGTSEEMFTLRRAYYENISDLSYLYDDFNDRQLHLSRGIQMAGAEINGLLRYIVTLEVPYPADASVSTQASQAPTSCG